MNRTTLVLTALMLLCPPALPDASPAMLHVPSDYPTIQSAIKDAAPGDEVVVEDGIHSGVENFNIDFLGKAITVRSLNLTPATCIIDCQGGFGDKRAFRFQSGEGLDSVVNGFTIRNGLAGGGGAILCENGSSPSISGCVFENNEVFGSANGGAIHADGGLAVVGCSFIGNAAAGGGGGAIYCTGGSPLVSGCVFEGNAAVYGGAIYFSGTIDARVADSRFSTCDGTRGGAVYANLTLGDVFEDNLFNDNSADWGAGIYLEECQQAALTGNLVTGNRALLYGGGIHVRESTGIVLQESTVSGNVISEPAGAGGGIAAGRGSSLSIATTILWGNDAARGPAVALVEPPDSIVAIHCSDVEGGLGACFVTPGSFLEWGGWMIGDDPLFCDPAEDNFNLQEASPCAAAAQPDCGRIGARDAECAGQLIDASLVCIPDTGTLPFQVMMSLELANLSAAQFRRVAGQIDVERADGSLLTHWRHGWITLSAEGLFTQTWPVMIPPRQSMHGENRFVLSGVDVTPPPYNQPPYWPSGQTATDSCTVTGIMD
jgi:parallel beta-helix repeat protein